MTRKLKWVRSAHRYSGRYSYRTRGFECQIDDNTRLWVRPGALRHQWFWSATIHNNVASGEVPGNAIAFRTRKEAEEDALAWYDKHKEWRDNRRLNDGV